MTKDRDGAVVPPLERELDPSKSRIPSNRHPPKNFAFPACMGTLFVEKIDTRSTGAPLAKLV